MELFSMVLLMGTQLCALVKTCRVVHNRVISMVCKLKKNPPGTKDEIRTVTADLTVLRMNDKPHCRRWGRKATCQVDLVRPRQRQKEPYVSTVFYVKSLFLTGM